MNKHILNVALAVALSGSALLANAASYTFTDLGTLVGDIDGEITSSGATAINAAGLVAGWSYIPSNNAYRYHATVWNGTTAIDLGTLGGSDSRATAINNAGQVAGSWWSYTPSGNSIAARHATVWNGTTGTDLGTFGGTSSSATAINNSGHVAVMFVTSGGPTNSTVWRNDGTTATNLGTGGRDSYATAINATGQVAGYASIAFSEQHATVWNGTAVTDLGTLGGTHSRANAINDAGLAAGYSYTTGNAARHATVWNGTTATDLGTLGGSVSIATAINNVGQVVGWSFTAGDATQYATVWNGTTATDLNSFLDASTVSAGWVLNEATGINDNGWIVGTASNGIQSHAFLLTPVPEAETYAMMLAGLGLVGWTTLRRRSATFNNSQNIKK